MRFSLETCDVSSLAPAPAARVAIIHDDPCGRDCGDRAYIAVFGTKARPVVWRVCDEHTVAPLTRQGAWTGQTSATLLRQEAVCMGDARVEDALPGVCAATGLCFEGVSRHNRVGRRDVTLRRVFQSGPVWSYMFDGPGHLNVASSEEWLDAGVPRAVAVFPFPDIPSYTWRMGAHLSVGTLYFARSFFRTQTECALVNEHGTFRFTLPYATSARPIAREAHDGAGFYFLGADTLTEFQEQAVYHARLAPPQSGTTLLGVDVMLLVPKQNITSFATSSRGWCVAACGDVVKMYVPIAASATRVAWIRAVACVTRAFAIMESHADSAAHAGCSTKRVRRCI